MTDRDRARATTPPRLVVIITSTLLGGLIAGVAVIGSESVEPGLTDAANQAITDAGHSGVNVRFDGREAFVSGTGASAAQLNAAELVVESVDGVRWASVERGAAQRGQGFEPRIAAGPDESESALLTGTDILFAPDSSALTDTALAHLTSVAEVLLRYPALRITVTGHIAIAAGTDAEVIAFSEQRAQAVVDELERLGVESTQLIAIGAGATSPVSGNDTDAGAAQNRRVTIEIVEGL